jgi:hypothetical protein
MARRQFWRRSMPSRSCAWRRTTSGCEAAEPIRYGLLYGPCDELVAAVAKVLTAARLTTVDLDEALGDTKSADLLVSGCAAASGRGKSRQRPSPRVARWIPAASPRHVSSAALRPTGEWRHSGRNHQHKHHPFRACGVCQLSARVRPLPHRASHKYRRAVQLVAQLRLGGDPRRRPRR